MKKIILGIFIFSVSTLMAAEGDLVFSLPQSLSQSRASVLLELNIQQEINPEKTLEQFSEKLAKARAQNLFQNASELLHTFRAFPLTESQWRDYAQKQSMFRWHTQGTWQQTVGGRLFLEAAVDEIHLSLIMAHLKRLNTETPHFNYEDVCQVMGQLIDEHSILRRRESLYTLAVSSQQGHPLSSILLNENLKKLIHLYYDSESKGEQRSDLEEYPKMIKKLDIVGKANFRRENWSEFIKSTIFNPIFEKVIILPDTQDNRLEKARIGMPHYLVKLGREIVSSEVSVKSYTNRQICDALELYKRAGELGDYEGYYEAAHLSYRWQNKQDEESFLYTEQKSLNEILRLFGLSSWLGNPEAYERIKGFSSEYQNRIENLWPAETLKFYNDVQKFFRKLK